MRTANELVMENIVRDSTLSRTTVYDRVTWLERVFLTIKIPAWSKNLTKRVTKHPKIYVTDSGLAASLLNVSPSRLTDPAYSPSGMLLESFVANEILRHLSWAQSRARVYHYRDSTGPEVDLVLEGSDGKIVAIEVKKTQSISTRDFRWLKLMRDRLGDDFVQGILIYLGRDTLPLSDRLTAIPLSTLWTPNIHE